MTIGRQTAPERPAAAIAVARMEAAPAISASVHTGSPERVTRIGRSSGSSGPVSAGSSAVKVRWRQLAAGSSAPVAGSASHSVPTCQPRLAPSASSNSVEADSIVAAWASTRVTSWRAASSCWPRVCSVMSWNCTKNSVGQPSASLSAVALTSTQRGWPSLMKRPWVWCVRISPVSMRSTSRLRAAHSSGWMVSASVSLSSCASVRPVSSHSASLTWRKRPSVPTIAMPVGALSNALPRRCCAACSARSVCLRSLMSVEMPQMP